MVIVAKEDLLPTRHWKLPLRQQLRVAGKRAWMLFGWLDGLIPAMTPVSG